MTAERAFGHKLIVRSAKKPQVHPVIVSTDCHWTDVINFSQVAVWAAAARLGFNMFTLAMGPPEDQVPYKRLNCFSLRLSWLCMSVQGSGFCVRFGTSLPASDFVCIGAGAGSRIDAQPVIDELTRSALRLIARKPQWPSNLNKERKSQKPTKPANKRNTPCPRLLFRQSCKSFESLPH